MPGERPCKLALPGSSQAVQTCHTLKCGLYTQAVAACNLIENPELRQDCKDQAYGTYIAFLEDCEPV